MSDLDSLIQCSIERVKNMTPQEREAMFRAQAASFVRAEAGFGSDADEAEYAGAVLSGDKEAIAECKRKSRARVAAVDAVLKEKGMCDHV